MIQKVFVVGATGGVAKETIKQMIDRRDNDSSLHVNPTMIVGLASRRSGYIYNQDGISDYIAKRFSLAKQEARGLMVLPVS